MAIYVYQTTNGILVSWIPEDLTIAQAQAQGQLASNAQLAAAGNSAVDKLPPLDESHTWDPTQKTVITITPPTPVNLLNTFDFIMAFTPAELAAIRGTTTDNNIQRFLYALEVTQGMNLNNTTIQNSLQYLVSKGLLTQARMNAILATVNSDAAYAVGRG
jgi:hypothetical protein